MALPAPHRIVRARQRSRTTLRSFTELLAPRLDEVGIDRMQIGVSGSWTVSGTRYGPLDYREALITNDPELPWFRRPAVRPPSSVDLATVRHPPGTISKLTVAVRGLDQSRGTIRAVIVCNPTRTLAHLLAAHAGDDFLERVEALPPSDFFDRSPGVPLGYGASRDNWLADVDLARAACGRDIFAGFLPFFLRQLQTLTMRLVQPYWGGVIHEDGGAHVMESVGCTVRLDWNVAKLPQVETYFERYHTQARYVIRSAAQTVLTSFNDAAVRVYGDELGFERSADLFSITSALANRRRLAVYAKAPQRIRFEVRRLTAGRYPPTSATGSTGRLLSALMAERVALLTACRWASVGATLVERPLPTLQELIALVARVLEAHEEQDTSVVATLEQLLTEGNIVLEQAGSPLITALMDAGVIERTHLSLREGPPPHVYGLRGDYRALFEALLSTFSASDAEA